MVVYGTFVSPFSPALWLAIGLAEANMGTYIKYAFFGWGFAIVLLLIAVYGRRDCLEFN